MPSYIYQEANNFEVRVVKCDSAQFQRSTESVESNVSIHVNYLGREKQQWQMLKHIFDACKSVTRLQG